MSEGAIGECGVGTIVWVRRRNGSWWPGRILGIEEIATSHVMSPRSGTPVKLLGREDASVDWYNLEKSKRVKSFRCGEFDACIEKAEAAQGVPIKKREKYARREDAILHALELEKQQLEFKQNKSGVVMDDLVSKPSAVPKSNNLFSSDVYTRNDDPAGMHRKYAQIKTKLPSGKPSLLHEEDGVNNSILINNKKGGMPIGLEEDASEAVPRMRGLQDFGLCIASKKKTLHSSARNASGRPSGTDSETSAPAGDGIGGEGYLNNGKSTLGTKRKRSNGGSSDESLVRKRDRRRPLVQVLQSSAKLQASCSPQLDSESHVISMRGEKDSLGVICRAKRSKCIYLPPDVNDTLEHSGYPPEVAAQFRKDSCLNGSGSFVEEYPSSDLFGMNESNFSGKEFLEDGDLLGDASQSLASGTKYCGSAILQDSEHLVESDDDEAPLCSYITEPHQDGHYADGSADVGVSNWHVKGKRNVRNFAKKSIDVADVKIGVTEKSNIRETIHGSKGSSYNLPEMDPSGDSKVGQAVGHKGKQATCSSDDVDLEVGFSQEQMFEHDNGQFTSALKSGRDRRNHTSFSELESNPHIHSGPPWEDGGQSNVARNFREESDECLDRVYPSHLSKERGSILVNVDLKVQSSYQGEHVPLVSLMSRLNGKAIIGHPVQVEILDDGSTNQYFPGSYPGSHEGKTSQPIWRTARRTAMQRIPRPNPVASALEDEDDSGFQYSGHESKPPIKKYLGHFKHQTKSVKKSSSHSRRLSSGKYQKKSLKKVSLASQKTRTLSSIATDPKRGAGTRDVKHNRGNNLVGLIKSEGSAPLVTCVPVKVAFSRILEAVGRPSAAPNRARIINTTVRGLS